jgi:hypothetical protein
MNVPVCHSNSVSMEYTMTSFPQFTLNDAPQDCPFDTAIHSSSNLHRRTSHLIHNSPSMIPQQQQQQHNLPGSPPLRRRKVLAPTIKAEIGAKVLERQKRRASLDTTTAAIKQAILESAKHDILGKGRTAHRNNINNNSSNNNNDASTSSLSLHTSRREQIGSEKLKTIENHKSLIAEMRPNRRRIKWTPSIADWQRKSDSSGGNGNHHEIIRVKEIELEDLQIHGRVPLPRPVEATGTTPENEELHGISSKHPGANLDEIERRLKRAYKTLRRINKDITRDQETAEKIKAENQELRKEILSLHTPKLQSLRQSHRQLTVTIDKLRCKVVEMDEQTALIRQQKEKLVEECRILQTQSTLPITDVDMRSWESDLISDITPVEVETAPVIEPEALQMFHLYRMSSNRHTAQQQHQQQQRTTKNTSVRTPRPGFGPPMVRLSATPAAA